MSELLRPHGRAPGRDGAGSDELQVVRTREEMKTRERVALAQARMRQQLLAATASAIALVR